MIEVMIFDGGKASYLYMILWKRKESKRLFRVIGKTFRTACRIIPSVPRASVTLLWVDPTHKKSFSVTRDPRLRSSTRGGRASMF